MARYPMAGDVVKIMRSAADGPLTLYGVVNGVVGAYQRYCLITSSCRVYRGVVTNPQSNVQHVIGGPGPMLFVPVAELTATRRKFDIQCWHAAGSSLIDATGLLHEWQMTGCIPENPAVERWSMKVTLWIHRKH